MKELTTRSQEDEHGDANFPPDLAAAMQLFIMAGLPDNASTCKVCVDRQIEILEKGPDGKTQHRLGTGAICWQCGFVGLPRNNEAFDAGRPKAMGSVAICSQCGSSDQTNLVNAINEDGRTRLPWIELYSENSEDQKRAAKGAEDAEKTRPPRAGALSSESKDDKRRQVEQAVAAARAKAAAEASTKTPEAERAP